MYKSAILSSNVYNSHFVPFTRIQNVSVSAMILDRLFKVRSVKIATASDEELKLEYLTTEHAEQLRAELLSD